MANPRSLAWYHENKDRIDKEKRKAYLKEYHLRNPEKRRRSPEQQEKINARRREKYAQDRDYREAQKSKAKDYNRRNPDIKKNQQLMGSFGITIDDYNELLERQHGKGAICGSSESKTRASRYFFVDHDHKTGEIRGLLCNNCNFALGHFQDDIERLENAIQYLKGERSGKVDSMVQS